MASNSKSLPFITLLLIFNILLFTNVSSHNVPAPCPPAPAPAPNPPTPTPSPPKKQPSCPKDTLKLGACVDLLKHLVHVVVGKPPKTPCCTLIKDLADLEAAVCLCTVIKANVIGNQLNIPVSLSLLLNYCGKGVPKGYQCA